MGDWHAAEQHDRENYLKETQNMAEYDNTNKGSLFLPRSEKAPCNLSGVADIDGEGFYIDLFKTDGSRCKAVLILKSKEDISDITVVPLFESTKGKAIMYGSFDLGDGKVYVNVLKKDRASGNGPVLGLYFNAAEGAGAAPAKARKAPSSDVDYDDIPF